MKKIVNKFSALTPEVLAISEQVYSEALDFAFGNKDIKNIAITGVYGAGKSTVWNTYVDQRKLNGIITVSLGQYRDIDQEEARIVTNKNIDEAITKNTNNRYDECIRVDVNSNENRIERQLINQILSQIDSKKIPLSKYTFKKNKSKFDIWLQAIFSTLMIFSILLWITRDAVILGANILNEKNSLLIIMFICGCLLYIPMLTFLYIFFKQNKFRISKITFKGAEANMDDCKNDESILDKDIKELVYLLSSAGARIIVFEDLDRYNNILIYTKLRELNFLLNNHIKVNKDKSPVRFVYMLKDSLFISKNRTKFFDFILPIVPVVDSRTSENELVKLMDDIENAPEKSLLVDISLYIDDMRLLKNIVNEYIVYSKVIPLKKLDLDNNKLFALIVLKNIFPNEFDLLQEDKGIIRNIFDQLEFKRSVVISELEYELIKINERIDFINSKIENDKFKAMALMISANVSSANSGERSWNELLRFWSENPEQQINIRTPSFSSHFTYDRFINEFILTNCERKALIEELPQDFSDEINKLQMDRSKVKKKISEVEIYRVKEIIDNLSEDEKEKVFSIERDDIIDSHYYPLIRFLIVEGLLDETYWYYKGNFNVDVLNLLKRNDIIYMKGLKEGKSLDIFFDIETPEEVMKRLKLQDFRRNNILNKKLLEACLEKAYTEAIVAVSESVDRNDNYKKFLEILNKFDLNLIKAFSNIMLDKNVEVFDKILKYCKGEFDELFRNILVSYATSKYISSDNLNLFRHYLALNAMLIELVPEEDFSDFQQNMFLYDIKFADISESKCSLERLKKIEAIQGYKLNIKNVIFIAERIEEVSINYGELLNVIFSSYKLSESKKYIENNFSSFITEYIRENKGGVNYKNNEILLLMVLHSEISEEYKYMYVEKNEMMITDLADLKLTLISTRIIDSMLRRNIIQFCEKNISLYLNLVDEYNNDFVEYLDRNLNDVNYRNILKNNMVLCNSLINCILISDRTFEYIMQFADIKIDKLDERLTQNRVNKLIYNGLVDITEENVRVLLKNLFYDELIMLMKSNTEVEDKVIKILLEYNLAEKVIYLLINSEISNENSKKLIDILNDKVLIRYIDSSKEVAIDYIVKRYLSSENIDYICGSFDNFRLKNEFILALELQGKLKDLKDHNLNEYLMQYILESSDISIDTKVQLIETKIKNKVDVGLLKQYMYLVKEVADISKVWDRKQPSLDNEYKMRLGQMLIKYGYAKSRKDGSNMRIRVENK